MKNKRFLLMVILMILLSLSLISCSKSEPLKADTPVNTAIVMEGYLKAGNYEGFNKLFTEGRKNTISIDQFNELKKTATNGTDLKHYELLTFSNGEMVLLTLTQEKVDGEYKIQDVKNIPEGMKEVFQ